MGFGSLITKLGGKGAKGAKRAGSKGAKGAKGTKGKSPRRKTRRDSFVDEFGGGLAGFARGFFSDLFNIDLSLGDQLPSLGVVGDAIGSKARSGLNMGRPAPQFNVASKVAKRYNTPTLQIISNQISDIIDSMSSINGQLQSQLDMTRFNYNESLKTQRESILEANVGGNAGALLASNDNSPTSTLGTNALVSAMTSVADQLKDLSDQLKGLDLDSIAQCCGGDTDIDYYGGGEGADANDDSRKKRRKSKSKGFRRLRVKARMLRRAADRSLRAAGRGALAFGAGAMKYGKGGLAGLAVGLGADFLADYLGRDTRGGAAAAVASKTATYAGTGSLIGAGIGSIVPVIGTGIGAAVGGAMGAVAGLGAGLYENWQPLTRPSTGVGSTGDAKKAMQFFTGRGWSPEQAAGIVGNLQTESGRNLNPNAIRQNDAGPGLHSYGIAQWNRDRFAGLQQFASQRRKQWNDFDTQLEYVDYELRNKELAAGQRLATTRSAEEAAAIVDQYYERSTGAARGQRIANATTLLEDYKKGSGGATWSIKSPLVGRDPKTGAPSLLLRDDVRKAMEQRDAGQGWGGVPYAPGKGPQDMGMPMNEYQKAGMEQGKAAKAAAAALSAASPLMAVGSMTNLPDSAIAKPLSINPEELYTDNSGKPGSMIAAKSAEVASISSTPEVVVVSPDTAQQTRMTNGATLPTSMVGTDGVPDPTFPELFDRSSPTCRAFYESSYRQYRRTRGGWA